MFRTFVEHTSRFSAAIFPPSPGWRPILRGGAIVVAAVMALLLALVFAPSSTRANLALCASQSESHSEHGKTDSHTATSLAIQQCID